MDLVIKPTLTPSEKKKKTVFTVLQIVFFLFLFIFVLTEGHKFKVIKNDFKEKYFVINFFVVILFTIIMIYDPFNFIKVNPKDRQAMKKATKHAIIAFIISLFAHLDLIFGSFFLVWYFVYASNDDIEL